MGDIIDIPVVIVGGGSCGLTLSIFLSDLGVDHVLFERHPGTSILPKAHIINQRSLEIFRQHGIVDTIRAQGTPPRKMSQVVWQTSLAGDGPLDRKVLGAVKTWGCQEGTEQYNTYLQDAPYLPTNLPLLRMEPIFRHYAEERNPGKVFFSHAVTSFEDQGSSVIVHVEAKDGTKKTYRTQYLVGADGGKTVGPALGIELDGPRNLRKIVSFHFKADCSQYWDDRTGIAHFADPERGATGMRSGSMLALGPTWGRHSEEWQMHFAIKPDEEMFPEKEAAERVRSLLKLPDLKMEVLSLASWTLERVLARSYGKGRVFIGGDSAHRHPPTTGLGLNTAVQDAHNLAWKLAYVLDGRADPSLLETYESERLPIGKRNCDWALFTSKNHAIIGAAIGMQDGDTAANVARLTDMFDDNSDTGRAIKAQLQYIIDGQSIEFHAHSMDLGFTYQNGAIYPDGTEKLQEDPRRQIYTPTTRPGSRLPHAMIDKEGELVSTHDLLGSSGNFLLITDRAGIPWVEAVKAATASHKIGLNAAVVVEPLEGALEGEYVDTDRNWARVKEIKKGGAVLVRPDGMVAWRALKPGDVGAVGHALDVILGGKRTGSVNGV